MGVIAQRTFNTAYIWLDTAFLVLFCVLLFLSKRKLTLLFALCGGVLYFLVDYGIFHLLTHSRTIEGGSMFWVLLWMSMSYGITNFAWIWLALRKDERFAEWTALILLWWLACPMLAGMFGNAPEITIARTTGAYHGFMALFLFLSYLAVIGWNIFQKEKKYRFRILWLIAIGVAVQFGWEFSLLIGGIRSSGIVDMAEKLRVLVVNSLLETNLGLPAIYCIYLFISRKVGENLEKLPAAGFLTRLEENNAKRYFAEKKRRCRANEIDNERRGAICFAPFFVLTNHEKIVRIHMYCKKDAL